MRCPRCHTETPTGAVSCPSCNLRTPRGKQEKARQKQREFDKLTRKRFLFFSGPSEKGAEKGKDEPRGRTRTIIRAAVMAGAVLATGLGCYLVVFSYWESKQVDPVLALKAMETLRDLPSNKEGFTVEQLMDQELRRARETGNLKSHQGWTTKRVRGSESKVLIVFSFRDIDDKEHRAEWLVNVTNNQFVPQTELAWEVYGK